jgi:tripartite-type tricarboxylate transporter receptor subunit TctC
VRRRKAPSRCAPGCYRRRELKVAQRTLRSRLKSFTAMRAFRFDIVCLALGAPVADAQTRAPSAYPNKPIRIIVPTSPGGGTDLVTRTVGLKLSELIGNPVVIENRGSAVGGIVGMDIASRATPDGYTLLSVGASTVLNAELVNKPAYDQRKTFTPIGQMTSQPYLLAVNAGVPAQSVGELIALAKNKPGALNAASPGAGSMGHLTLELFNSIGNVEITHIPYKGAGPAAIDLVAGHVQMAFVSVATIAPHLKSSKVRALAVTSAQRSRLQPHLPTLIESGLPGLALSGWYGLLAPAGTPKDVIKVLNDAMVRALRLPEVAARFAADGSEPAPGTPEQFGDRIDRDIQTWTQLFERAKIKL